ncbi:MAG: hypothetical protein LAQ69_41465 [Acidobacteriia bacterium]|nr:hypothetical protein [Terriglobia bacterium]
MLLQAGGVQGVAPLPVSFLYTEAPRYDATAALKGGERFPSGAALELVSGGRKRALAPGFAASADASVSFDGQRVLFAGKQQPGDRWQIWEMPLNGGTARRIVSENQDGIAPFYLPGDRLVYSRRSQEGFQLVSVAPGGVAPLQLTYGPGNRVACDVLRDGRILFEAPHPASAARDLYTVYSDGSGVGTYRCDHGRDRHAGRELLSGDILFETAGRLARFTSSRAIQLEVSLPMGEFAGPVAEIAPGDWLVSYRANGAAPYGLYRWRTGQVSPEPVPAAANGAFQPVLVRAHAAPKRHPSGLGDRDGANLLCLNVYSSKLRIPEGSVTAVRVWALDDRGAAVEIGQAPVEKDGSFFVQAPSERPIRFELLDRTGKSAEAEKGWFWARRGEQRVCVGCHAGPERAPENAVPEVLRRTTEPVRLKMGGAK